MIKTCFMAVNRKSWQSYNIFCIYANNLLIFLKICTKKRDFRALWITRISAQAKVNGINYSQLMYGLKKAGVTLNRKVLADIAVSDKDAFASLVESAKAAL